MVCFWKSSTLDALKRSADFYCFGMIVHGFPEAPTDTIWIPYFFTETSMVCAQNRYFENSNVKPPRHNRVGDKWDHAKALVKHI